MCVQHNLMFESWIERKCKFHCNAFSILYFRLVLDTFVANNFPLKSTEFVKGGPQYNDYIHALDKVNMLYKGWCYLNTV